MDLEKKLPDVIDVINIVNKERNKDLQQRLVNLQESGKNVELWDKISKGYNTVKNSSIGIFAVASFGVYEAFKTGFDADAFCFIRLEAKRIPHP